MTDFDLSAGGKKVPPEFEGVTQDEHNDLVDAFKDFADAFKDLESRLMAIESHLARQTGFVIVDPLAPIVPVPSFTVG